MSETNETVFSETAKPGSATSETVLISVDEAAGVLGISPQAVRKRINKGQLNARRDGRAWQVILDRETIETSETETAATAAQPRTKPGAQPGTLVAQQQAEQMAALVASIQAPLLDRIESANREAERERMMRESTERERDEPRAEVELLRAMPQHHEPEPETRTMPLSDPPMHPGREEAPAMAGHLTRSVTAGGFMASGERTVTMRQITVPAFGSTSDALAARVLDQNGTVIAINAEPVDCPDTEGRGQIDYRPRGVRKTVTVPVPVKAPSSIGKVQVSRTSC